MFNSKYSAVLTIILIILIIAIIIIGLIFGIKIYKEYTDEKEKEAVYAQIKNGDMQNSGNNQNENDIAFNVPLIDINAIQSQESTNNTSTGTSTRRKTQFYKDYPMVGYIKIDKTNVSYPILLDGSPGALDTAVSAVYPSNPKLNQPGNVVIIGHNYRNGKFFANNKELVVGDKIEITDLEGKTLEYTIYEIFQTSDSDTSYITRDRGNNIEVSLSTCTDDGKARLVILARVEQ